MNFIDIILCAPLLWGLFKGFRKGLIVEIATFISFGLGTWGAFHFSDYVSEKLKTELHLQSPYLPIISFSIIFLLIVIIIYLIAKLIQHLVEGMAMGWLNKITGAIVGALKYALIMSVIIFIFNAIEKNYPILSFKNKDTSMLYKPIGKIAPFFIPELDKRGEQFLPKK